MNQYLAVEKALRRGDWLTLPEIADFVKNEMEAARWITCRPLDTSVSATIRRMRKRGHYITKRERFRNLWEYMLTSGLPWCTRIGCTRLPAAGDTVCRVCLGEESP